MPNETEVNSCNESKPDRLEVVIDSNEISKMKLSYEDWVKVVKEKMLQAGFPCSDNPCKWTTNGTVDRFDDPSDWFKTIYVWTPECKPEKCECDDLSIEPHYCPFEDEVKGNSSDDYCTCCASCERECSRNV